MGRTDPAGGPAGGGRAGGHETRDVDVRAITLSALVLAALVGISMLVMLWTYDYFARREAGRQPAPSTLAARPADRIPPEPRLQQNPLAELQSMREEEQARITSYGWVDRSRGVARIPVERAMEIAVQRGLPARAPEGKVPDAGAPPRAGADAKEGP